MSHNSRNALPPAIAATPWAAPPVFATALEKIIVAARKREENLQQVPTA